MKRPMVILVVATAAVAWGCEDRVQSPCTPNIVEGLAVLVVSEQTGEHVCDAVVTASEGAYSETLHPRSWAGISSCLFMGASERNGTYRVRAEAAGFAPGTVSNVKVPLTEDGCHVQTVRTTIRLVPTGSR
jgi:hypothetical protein